MKTKKEYVKLLSGYPDLLSFQQVKEVIGVGEAKLYIILKENRIRYFRIKDYYFPKVWLVEFLMSEDYIGHTKQ